MIEITPAIYLSILPESVGKISPIFPECRRPRPIAYTYKLSIKQLFFGINALELQSFLS